MTDGALGAPSPAVAYPRLRWLALAWLAVYVPVYAQAYGPWHFLFLCNLGVLTTAFGLLLGNRLLLSSQAVAAPVIALLWIADVCCKLVSGRYLHGGAAYMWDASVPTAARVLSLYHALWPFLLFHCLRKAGYDRRGFALQSALAAVSMAVALWIAPVAENIDYVFHWPGATVGPLRPPGEVAIILGATILGVYWPTHRLIVLAFPARKVAPPVPASALDEVPGKRLHGGFRRDCRLFTKMPDLPQKTLLFASLLPYLALAAYDGWLHTRARVVPFTERCLHAVMALSFTGLAWALFSGSERAAVPSLAVFVIALIADELGFHAVLEQRERRLHHLAYACFAGFVIAAWAMGALRWA